MISISKKWSWANHFSRRSGCGKILLERSALCCSKSKSWPLNQSCWARSTRIGQPFLLFTHACERSLVTWRELRLTVMVPADNCGTVEEDLSCDSTFRHDWGLGIECETALGRTSWNVLYRFKLLSQLVVSLSKSAISRIRTRGHKSTRFLNPPSSPKRKRRIVVLVVDPFDIVRCTLLRLKNYPRTASWSSLAVY